MDKKLDALNRIDKGESLKNIASELGVGTSTVSDWKKNRKEIEEFCFKMISKDSLEGRGTIKKAKNEELDEALFVWYSLQRERGVPISGPILAQKALLLNSKLPSPDVDFTASQGWLDRWKTRHGVRQLTVTGESLSSDTAGSEKFKKEFEEFVLAENLTPDQVFNADETGLFYRLLPSKTLASKVDDAAKGYKKNKDRLTAMACSNASGKCKLPLVIVGKSKKPRALKNVNHDTLPVAYKAQKSAWMDGFIFKNWFFKNFVPDVKKFLKEKNLPAKAILLIDNAPSHPGEKELVEGDIKVKFLPPNVTPLIQPMDQGVLDTIKRYYRKELLTKILTEEENESVSVSYLLKSINIKHVIYMIADAWDRVSEKTLNKSWKKLWPAACLKEELSDEYIAGVDSDKPSDDELLQMCTKISGCSEVDIEDIREWVKDNNDGGYGVLADEEIIASVTSTQETDSEVEEEEGMAETQMTHADATTQLDNIMAYLERQADTTPTELLVIKRLRDRAAFKRHASVKQTKLDKFFRPNV